MIDVSVFRDIETEVNETSDIVCNGELDIGDMIVEHNETNDEEQRRIARFLTSGCSCKLLDGIPCMLHSVRSIDAPRGSS